MKTTSLQRQIEQLAVEESLLFTGNGYLGIRANFEEGYPSAIPTIRGTYLNGFYDIINISAGEDFAGFPRSAQKMVNVIDGQSIDLYFGAERFSLFSGEVLELERELDTYRGVAIRRVLWKSPSGKRVKLCFTRMTSFATKEMAIIRVEIESVNFTGELSIDSFVNGSVENFSDMDDPRVGAGHVNLLELNTVYVDGDYGQVSCATKRSKLQVCCSVGHTLPLSLSSNDGMCRASGSVMVGAGETIELIKYLVYTDSIRHNAPQTEGMELLQKAMSLGYGHHILEQKSYLDDFWARASVSLAGNEDIEESLRFSIYQLMASAGRDVYSNIAAKGLSGEGYEGHYFWDTEIYMLPFFTLTCPEIARNLLLFRCRTLPEARKEAKQLGHKKGAKIPWRTISGSECSIYFAAGSAQYHINADVAFACVLYFLVHRDFELMFDGGFELLYETARLWLEVGHCNDAGQFMIYGVTGPDEYTAMVNNNYYTNAMARYHLRWVVKLAAMLAKEDHDRFAALFTSLEGSDEELSEMQKAADAMYFAYDNELGIYWQDGSFKEKPEWNFADTPKENYPLLLHYHPLLLYRHKVIKQADTLLALILLSEESNELLARCYDYYGPLTTHDSSLSPCVHAIAAARIGRLDLAFELYQKTLRLDLDNLHHNTRDGLHIANAGGAYLVMIFGFAGLRATEEGIHLNPSLPKGLPSISFTICPAKVHLEVEIAEKIRMRSEKEVTVYIQGQQYCVKGDLVVNYQRS